MYELKANKHILVCFKISLLYLVKPQFSQSMLTLLQLVHSLPGTGGDLSHCNTDWGQPDNKHTYLSYHVSLVSCLIP